MPASTAQSRPAPAYDGHGPYVGVWGGDPLSVPASYAHSAINRFFREDSNRTRPQIVNLIEHFESEDDETWFRGGNGQGAFFYQGFTNQSQSRIIASIAGKIFAGNIIGRDCYWSVLFEGNSAQFCNAWFAQGFEWLFIQDGINRPIFWNGTDTPRRSDPTKNEMPVGSVMAYIHGRMAVASADNQNTIQVGDIVYGSNVTNHDDLLKFTEQTYWAEGGSFDLAANLGDIMGLYPMPWLNTGTGANELVALCTNGFTSFDFSGARETWIDNQVQKISMIGQGCVSSIGFAGLNGDVFYRRNDGIGSYRNARTEFTQTWRATPVSREVNQWLKFDRQDLLKFVPMVSWQNMVFTGISPQIEKPNNPCAGFHRYCRGMVVLDAQSQSTASRDGAAVWHGAWTGIRPWALLTGRINSNERCFAFSFDRDGRNRLYELTLRDAEDQFDYESRKQYWRYDTPAFGQAEARCSYFDLKKMTGGQIVFSDIPKAADWSVKMKPDGAPCYVLSTEGEIGCDCATIEDCGISSGAQWANQYLKAVPVDGPDACVPGTESLAGYFHYAQFRIEGHAPVKVEHFRVRMEIKEADEVSRCSEQNCERVSCCPDIDNFSYHIAPAGTNNDVPDIECPAIPEDIYRSTRYWTAYCPSIPGLFKTGVGQAESTISQEDADAKALAAAQENAEQLLSFVCPECDPFVMDSFVIDGGSQDLSSFFASGGFANNALQPWRLVDIFTLALIATGHVDEDGTLVTDNASWGYEHGTFDPDTNTYTDDGGGSTTINLQMGCNINGSQTWPDSENY